MRVSLPDDRVSDWIPGALAEVAFRDPEERIVVLTTDDVPFEEGLHATLLSRSGGLLDTVSLARLYGTGELRDVAEAGPRSVRFSFFPDDCWRLDVPAGPVTRRPRWMPRILRPGLMLQRLR